MSCDIRAPVLLNLLNSMRKRDKMLDKPRILSLSQTCLIHLISISLNLIVSVNFCSIIFQNSLGSCDFDWFEFKTARQRQGRSTP